MAGVRQVAQASAKVSAVLLLVDTSESMASRDVAPWRLGAAYSAMANFLYRLPATTRVGLVSFSTTAHILDAPTVRRSVVETGLKHLAPAGGSSLGAGLADAIKVIQQEDHKLGNAQPAVIVLVSDGGDNGKASATAEADQAKSADIRIDGVAVGTPKGAVEVRYRVYGHSKIYSTSIPVPVAPKIIETVSRLTGGKSFGGADVKDLRASFIRVASMISH